MCRRPSGVSGNDGAGKSRDRRLRAQGQAERARTLDLVYGIFRGSPTARNSSAGTMSGGEQQMLAVGAA